MDLTILWIILAIILIILIAVGLWWWWMSTPGPFVCSSSSTPIPINSESPNLWSALIDLDLASQSIEKIIISPGSLQEIQTASIWLCQASKNLVAYPTLAGNAQYIIKQLNSTTDYHLIQGMIFTLYREIHLLLPR